MRRLLASSTADFMRQATRQQKRGEQTHLWYPMAKLITRTATSLVRLRFKAMHGTAIGPYRL
jgi:hypothetical protein